MMWLCGISFLLLTIFNQVHAGYRPRSLSNVVAYYGQNSWGSRHQEKTDRPYWQGRLKDHCNDTSINVINIAFLVDLVNLRLNLANLNGQQDLCPDGLDFCRNMEDDIKTCQANGIDIVLSIGGENSMIRSFNDAEEARKSAQNVWYMFGPASENGKSQTRPFGNSAVNGFDLDIETPQIEHLPEWAEEMRRLAENYTMLLTASPECSHNDTVGPMSQLLASNVTFDYMNVQFYNNKNCWVGNTAEIQSDTLQQWDNWAISANSSWLVGVAAGKGACYQPGCYKDDLSLFEKPKNYTRFAGVAAWDLSWSKNNGFFHRKAKDALTSNSSTLV